MNSKRWQLVNYIQLAVFAVIFGFFLVQHWQKFALFVVFPIELIIWAIVQKKISN